MKVSPEASRVLSGMKTVCATDVPRRQFSLFPDFAVTGNLPVFPFYGGKDFFKKRILAENCRFGVFPEFFLFPV